MTTLPIETEEQRQDACTPAAQKLCRSCKFPMPVDANKCTKCSSLQNWRRYLDNSSIVLSLLVALTSVLTFAIPIWKDALVPKVASPAATLVEVDSTGLATLVVSNGGNAPAVVEQILMGADDGVVSFDLNPLSADKRVIRANGINVFALRLDIENSVDSVWELVKIFRSNGSCQLRLDVISPNGKRTTTDVDVSSAGMEKSEEKNGCPLKLRKLSTMTLTALGKRPEYVTTLCKVAELHPRDPKHPEVGSACKK